uniref:Amino acid transporter n=1 Tax=Rhizophora mucronata TaxID=61149 RepID=A0A2P2INS2_RHIMU
MAFSEAGLLISSVFSISSTEPERRNRMSASRIMLYSGLRCSMVCWVQPGKLLGWPLIALFFSLVLLSSL